jgi:hypothetical protein
MVGSRRFRSGGITVNSCAVLYFFGLTSMNDLGLDLAEHNEAGCILKGHFAKKHRLLSTKLLNIYVIKQSPSYINVTNLLFY